MMLLGLWEEKLQIVHSRLAQVELVDVVLGEQHSTSVRVQTAHSFLGLQLTANQLDHGGLANSRAQGIAVTRGISSSQQRGYTVRQKLGP